MTERLPRKTASTEPITLSAQARIDATCASIVLHFIPFTGCRQPKRLKIWRGRDLYAEYRKSILYTAIAQGHFTAAAGNKEVTCRRRTPSSRYAWRFSPSRRPLHTRRPND